MYWFKVPKKRWRGRHRRRRYNLWYALREWLWPSMGLMPMLRWFELRIKRNSNATKRTSMGVAIGVAVSFTPFFGLHMLLVFIFAKLLKGNFWIGVLATFVGNPWTFPFITFWTFSLGHFILGSNGRKGSLSSAPPLREIWNQLPYFWEHYIWPMTVGGAPTGVVVGVVTYFFVRGSIRRFQHMRIEKIRAARLRYQEERKNTKRFKMLSKVFLPHGLLTPSFLKKEHEPPKKSKGDK